MPGALDAVLFQTLRDWVIITTNTSGERAEAMAVLPRALPYAPWGSLLDGRVVAMRESPAGPIWNLVLEPGAARIYVAAKKPIKNSPHYLPSMPYFRPLNTVRLAAAASPAAGRRRRSPAADPGSQESRRATCRL